MAKKKSTIQEQVEEKVITHIEEKQQELTAKAETQTVWYKKAAYYIAAGVGGIIVTLVSVFSDDLANFLQGIFS